MLIGTLLNFKRSKIRVHCHETNKLVSCVESVGQPWVCDLEFGFELTLIIQVCGRMFSKLVRPQSVVISTVPVEIAPYVEKSVSFKNVQNLCCQLGRGVDRSLRDVYRLVSCP